MGVSAGGAVRRKQWEQWERRPPIAGAQGLLGLRRAAAGSLLGWLARVGPSKEEWSADRPARAGSWVLRPAGQPLFQLSADKGGHLPVVQVLGGRAQLPLGGGPHADHERCRRAGRGEGGGGQRVRSGASTSAAQGPLEDSLLLQPAAAASSQHAPVTSSLVRCLRAWAMTAFVVSSTLPSVSLRAEGARGRHLGGAAVRTEAPPVARDGHRAAAHWSPCTQHSIAPPRTGRPARWPQSPPPPRPRPTARRSRSAAGRPPRPAAAPRR